MTIDLLQILKQMPYFHRSGGRDHVFVFPRFAISHFPPWMCFSWMWCHDSDLNPETNSWFLVADQPNCMPSLMDQWSRSAFGERLAYFSQPVYISHSGGGSLLLGYLSSLSLYPAISWTRCCIRVFSVGATVICRVIGQIKRGSAHSTRGRISSYPDLLTQGSLPLIRLSHL